MWRDNGCPSPRCIVLAREGQAVDVYFASKLHRHLFDKPHRRTELTGYLRRDVASYISPTLEEGTILEAKLWRLGGSEDEEFSIAIWPEKQ
jgi:hypothetical protein